MGITKNILRKIDAAFQRFMEYSERHQRNPLVMFAAGLLIIAIVVPWAIYRAARQNLADREYAMFGFVALTIASFAYSVLAIVRGI